MDTENTAPPPGPEPPPSVPTIVPRPTLQLGEMGTPRPRRFDSKFELPGTNVVPPKTPDNNVIEKKLKEIMKQSGILYIRGVRYQSEMKELEELGELGFGTSGHVFKMLHIPSQEIVAVKQMRRSGNTEENKRIAMDLEVVLKSHDCPYIVQCLGCFITQAEVWICMELMSTCFDKLLKRLGSPIPEPIVGKVTLATVRALHYLKEAHGVIHRDVKPSNILLDDRGNVKLCDFGISGHLVNSKADSKNAGCTAYLAPERIIPPDPTKPTYDIRADVWALGITLVELATGVFPYPGCTSDFEVLSRVLEDDPPTLPAEGFSSQFRDFLHSCLAKDYTQRPKYRELLDHPFLRKYMEENVDVASWYARFSPSAPSIQRNGSGQDSTGGHQRSLSDASSIKVPCSSFKLNSPLLTKKITNGVNSGPSSPLLLQRFWHQQAQADRRRSTSVSPSRARNGISSKYAVPETSGERQGSGSSSAGSGRKKLATYLRTRLGSCGGGTGGGGSGGDNVPEPPPRSNRGISPLGNRRGPASPPSDVTSSPSLPRRYVSPSPPQPPPRRLSESVSVPASPHHTRLAVFTPQPLRRLLQHRPAQAQTGSSTQQ